MAIETSTPGIEVDCLACGAACSAGRPCGHCGVEPGAAPASAGRPQALAPSIDRWTAARRLARSAWPLPLRQADLASALAPGRLRPVFVPAWSLELRVDSTWTCGSERSGSRSQTFNGLVVPAVSGRPADVISAALAGAQSPEEVPAAELSEWNPLGVTRPAADAWRAACAQLSESAAEEAALGLSLEETDRLTVETRFETGKARPLLVPAWKARVRVRDRELSVFVDACQGQVVGSLPWNGRRLTALAAASGSALGALWALIL